MEKLIVKKPDGSTEDHLPRVSDEIVTYIIDKKGYLHIHSQDENEECGGLQIVSYRPNAWLSVHLVQYSKPGYTPANFRGE